MLNTMRFFLLFLISWIIPFQTFAMIGGSSHVKVELVQEQETIRPNCPFWVALHLKLEDDWHVYWKNPGDAGMPLKIEWKLPEGFKAGPLQWPFPEKFTVADMVGFGYKGEVVLLSQITPPENVPSTDALSLEAQVKWLVCSSLTCQPGSATAILPLKISANEPSLKEDCVTIFKQAREKIPQTHVEIKTIRKHGLVQLEVPQHPTDTKKDIVQEAYFFPEQKNVIDHTIEPTVAQSVSDSSRYMVNLKGSDEIGAKSQQLKGVLVLHKQQGMEKSIQAFDIDSPIEDDNEPGILSFIDTAKFSSSSNAEIKATPTASSPSATYEGGLSLALVFAFIGGMILNLMPCVLPVISFKVMSFVKMAGQSRSLTLKHGLMFSLGVIISFWALASVMLVLRTYGQAIGWGFQLQEPLFVIVLASILFIFALSLFGVFEWGMFFASWAGQTQAENVQKSSGYFGSFCSGVLATAVATPCTGPFLGSAIGFAVTLPVFQSMLIFTSLALGMCFPYLLLAAFPSYLRFLPKPGAWMETFKQLMGFLLLATVLWLLWVFSAQTDTLSLMCLLAGFFFFSFAAWVYGKGCAPFIARKKRLLAFVSVLVLVFIGGKIILLPSKGWDSAELALNTNKTQWDGWEEFSPQRVAELRKAGTPILIDFTAKWCLICQANHLVLDSEEVQQQLNRSGVVKMKADWTRNDPIITEALSQFGRNSVPLYVVYGPNENQEPVILPQVLTPDVVMDHLETAEIALK